MPAASNEMPMTPECTYENFILRTPEKQHYVEQTTFPILDADGNGEIVDYVDNECEWRVLREAIAIARRLCFCPRGEAILNKMFGVVGEAVRLEENDPRPIPEDLDALDINESILHRQRWFAIHGQFEVCVDPSIRSSYAYVDRELPSIIHIRQDILTSAGLAEGNSFRNPIIRDYALLNLSIILMHELTHVMRGFLVGAQKFTPPKCYDGVTLSQWEYSNGYPAPYYDGEGGWMMEQYMMGGQIYGLLYGEDHPNRSYEGKLAGLILQRHQPEAEWFYIAHEDCCTILEGAADWVDVLPLKPRSATTYKGTNEGARLRQAGLSIGHRPLGGTSQSQSGRAGISVAVRSCGTHTVIERPKTEGDTL
ncbi:uncharacterized protein I303_106499 [Kwoniella dejecticola CBS 10117]|uniref:Uncharacterized protein n=1 Tax=Kwoniella dejecticola CBS 10117 TaxID=1296121 RepID=A0A1A5ZUJ1_9TREE|nr:uncharacterized protein I303_08243 [Kwoniella dejecticola CBS 10117]OBR81473.1 hypothetical protein I303_08243 [Kwoniella dejecticola CBS 10117]